MASPAHVILRLHGPSGEVLGRNLYRLLDLFQGPGRANPIRIRFASISDPRFPLHFHPFSFLFPRALLFIYIIYVLLFYLFINLICSRISVFKEEEERVDGETDERKFSVATLLSVSMFSLGMRLCVGCTQVW